MLIVPASKVSVPPDVVTDSCVSSPSNDFAPPPNDTAVAFEWPICTDATHVWVDALSKESITMPFDTVAAVVVACTPNPLVKFEVAGVAPIIVVTALEYPVTSNPLTLPNLTRILLVPLVETSENITVICRTPDGMGGNVIDVPEVEFCEAPNIIKFELGVNPFVVKDMALTSDCDAAGSNWLQISLTALFKSACVRISSIVHTLITGIDIRYSPLRNH
jgi:hypothetical protein